MMPGMVNGMSLGFGMMNGIMNGSNPMMMFAQVEDISETEMAGMTDMTDMADMAGMTDMPSFAVEMSNMTETEREEIGYNPYGYGT